jgi:outer membrane protein OmpA-like peptidoglycan-associated protein
LTDQAPVNGVYKTNFNLMWLQQSGTDVEGCYDWDNGTLTGSTDGRVVRFQWVEDGPQIGTAVMVLTADGSVLNGLWYEQGAYRGLWFGNRVSNAEVPACRTRIKDDSIGHSLDTMGRAILYGIYFDYDSATLKPSSMNTLQQVLSALSARPEMKLVIEGHTDSQGSDNYNLDLSKRRAESVKTWLTDKGIAENRLEARGYGESRPVADNRQPDGRALNRRVEIAVTP